MDYIHTLHACIWKIVSLQEQTLPHALSLFITFLGIILWITRRDNVGKRAKLTWITLHTQMYINIYYICKSDRVSLFYTICIYTYSYACSLDSFGIFKCAFSRSTSYRYAIAHTTANSGVSQCFYYIIFLIKNICPSISSEWDHRGHNIVVGNFYFEIQSSRSRTRTRLRTQTCQTYLI